MSDRQLSSGQDDTKPEVRLEFTSPEGRQVWALYPERPEQQQASSDLSFLLHDLPGIAWWGRWIIGASLLVSLGLATAYLLTTDAIYKLDALISIERRGSPVGSYEVLRSGTDFMETQAEVLSSPLILAPALERVGFEGDPDSLRSPVSQAQAAFSVTPIRGTRVLAINFRSIRPEEGVRVIETVIDEYQRFARDVEVTGHTEGLELLRASDAKLGRGLAELEERYRVARLAPSGDQGDPLGVQRTILEQSARAVVDARSRRIDLENRLAAARWSMENAPGGVVSSGSDALDDELRQARVRLAQLTATYSERHPEVQSVAKQVSMLERQAQASAAVGTAAPVGLESELRAARQTEERLAVLYREQLDRARELDVVQVEQEELRAEIRRVAQEQEGLRLQLREKELILEALSSGRAGVIVRVLQDPGSSIEKVWPRTSPVLMVFILIGAIAGLGLALALHRSRSGEWETPEATRHPLHRPPGLGAASAEVAHR